ncbi:uncharacterized protein RJT21DRAFT_124643 [Scheffersomyces amazonensis]|uniref:uncharacterized protein n=1 Tax=Scheffersomyces amazonensis TaxID=1078765 RepID=UPI00315D657C
MTIKKTKLTNPKRTNPYVNEPIVSFRGVNYSSTEFNNNDINLAADGGPVNLVLCLDGTDNEFGIQPYSNVLKIFGMLEKDNDNQVCYYQPGVGVNFKAESNNYQEVNYVSSKASKITNSLDSVLAFTLDKHVIAAYNFLCRFYKRGDHIYLFGFSRGSFCARILAGMIERVGLLNKGLEEMTPTAWDLYSNWEYAGQPAQIDSSVTLVEAFRRTFSRSEVDIHFMGLWDTINSVGIIRDRLFPYTIRSAIVEHVRHAVSIDERRAKFKQVLFEPYSYYPHLFNLDCDSCDEEDQNQESATETSSLLASTVSSLSLFGSKVKRNRSFKLENLVSEDVIELYFPGNHGDCGGGWPSDSNGQFLSNVPLRWILSEALKYGVIFKKGALHEFDSKHPSSEGLLSCHHDMLSYKKGYPHRHKEESFADFFKRIIGFGTTTQPVAENHTKFQGINFLDSNTFNNNIEFELPDHPVKRFDGRGNESTIAVWFWWLIELLPMVYKVEDKNGEWKQVIIPNLGRHRKIPNNCKLHWSFFFRLHYIEDYTPHNISEQDLGSKFVESLKQFKDYDKDKLKNFATDLTFDRIRNYNDNDNYYNQIWETVPNELQELLDNNPDL